MSADRTPGRGTEVHHVPADEFPPLAPGRPTEREWAEALCDAVQKATGHDLGQGGAGLATKALAPLIARVEAAARAEGAASVAGPVLAVRDEMNGLRAAGLPLVDRSWVVHKIEAAIPTEAVEALGQVKADERERIARAIEGKYLGPDSGRQYDGREAPDAHCRNAYDEGLETAASIARETPP